MASIIKAGTKDKEGFIYVPSMNLYVAKERTHYIEDWHKAHEALAEENLRMLTIPEFVNFLNYLREYPFCENPQVYNDITQVKSPWRAEWLDAYFEERKDGFYVLTGNKTKAEKLEKYLMKDQRPGISLDSWLKNPTSQGLPKPDVAEGELYYWHPRDDGVARFYADSHKAVLDCYWGPPGRFYGLGVRAVKQRE